MSSINDFLSSINRYSDLARSDRFKAFIYPTGTRLGSIINGADLVLRCEEAEFPGRTLATADLRTYGPIVKYPTLTTYNDLNLTFLCSANRSGTSRTGLPEKVVFDDWMDLINPSPSVSSNPQSTPFWNMNYKTEYMSNIYIVHYDTVENRPTYGVRIYEAFPIAMNQVSLSWSTDAIIKLVVTFSYTRWAREDAFSALTTNTSEFARTAPGSEIAGDIIYLRSAITSTPMNERIQRGEVSVFDPSIINVP